MSGPAQSIRRVPVLATALRVRAERLLLAAGGGAGFESLESREILSAVSWDGGASTANWHDALNWSNDAVPTVDDDVTIPDTALTSISFAATTGVRSVNSLNSAESLTFFGGTLNVATTASTTAPVTLSGGTLSGGSWTTGSFTVASGTLINVALGGDITLSSGANVTLAGTTTFGTLHMFSSSLVSFGAAYTLRSTIRAEGPGSGARTLRSNVLPVNTLTIAPTGRIERAADCAGSLLISGSNLTLINQGTIANGAGVGAVAVNTGTFSNLGQLSATDSTLTISGAWSSSGAISIVRSTLNLGGTFSTAGLNLGAFTREAGTVNITGTMSNEAMTFGSATGTWVLAGGSVNGGTISASGGFTLECGAGSLSDVTFLTDLLVVSSTITTGVNISATVNFQNARLKSGATLRLPGNGYVMNSAIIADGPGTTLRRITGSSPGPVTIGQSGRIELAHDAGGPLTIGSSLTSLTCYGLIENNSPTQTLTLLQSGATYAGQIRSTAGTIVIDSTWTNTGLISASNATVNFRGTWTNTGTVELENATANLGGVFTLTTEGAAGFQGNGASINITGTMNVTWTTLAPTPSLWVLKGGTISGGTVTLAPGTVLHSESGTLLDTTIEGDVFVVPSTGRVTLRGNTQFNSVLLSAGAGVQIYGAYTLFDTIRAVGPGTAARFIGGTAEDGSQLTVAPIGRLELAPDCQGEFTYSTGGLLVQNNGTFAALAPGKSMVNRGYLTNHNLATRTLTGGTWIAQNGSRIVTSFSSTAVTFNATALSLSGPGSVLDVLVSNPPPFNLFNNGSISLAAGASLALNSLTNSGTLSLDADSSISCSGTFTQTATGVLDVDLAAPDRFGHLTAAAASLAGALSVRSSGGFDPSRPALPLFGATLIEATTSTGSLTLSSQPPLAVGSYVLRAQGGSLVLLHNIADFNGDGSVDGDDVTSYFAMWDSANAFADVNGDGSVDSDDVIFFFALWDNGGR